ncbi:MAG: hypothetical protein M1825_002951 [Sarcosagium campestre]|nr:MAG: hypothetical protein M1825_002951 [Sarcosagium campestre]
MTTTTTEVAPATTQILDHDAAPVPKFAFSDFLQREYRFGLDPSRPLCKAFVQGHCPQGNACPDRHTPANASSSSSSYNNLVCKHWLRGLCKKGDACEFLHEFNLRKMPECNFFLRNKYCSNGDECHYLHVDPDSRLPPCPHYDKGFCPLGPRCSKLHARKQLCAYYLAGFCPYGKACTHGVHAAFPADLPPPTVMVKKDPAEVEREQMALQELAERNEERDRERGFGNRRDWGRGRGGGAGGGGGARMQRGRRGGFG